MKITFDFQGVMDKYGLKQKEVATKCGLSKVTICKIYNNHTSPSVEKLILISEKMGIPINEFFKVDSGENNEKNLLKCPYCNQPIDVVLTKKMSQK